MSIFNKLINIGRAQVDAADAALADPARDGKYDIVDAKKEIDGLTNQIVALVTQNNVTLRTQKEAQENVDKYTNAAQAAAKAGKEDDVRTLLTQKSTFADKVKGLQGDIDRNNQLIAKMRKQRDDASAKVAKAESALAVVSASQTSNNIRQSLAKDGATFGGGNSAISRLDKLNAAAAQSDAQTDAWEQEEDVQKKATGADLVDAYTSPSGVDDEVAKMMAANKPSAPVSETVAH